MEPDQYRPTVLAKLFHKLPHINITLHYVNSTFIPDSETYLESLGILGSIPAAWLILTLFVLLVYLCTRCCDRKPRPKHSISLLKWTLSIFTLLCCGAVGVGLYGNDDVHNAAVQFISAVKAVDEKVSAVKNQTSTIESTLQSKVKPLLTELSDVFDDPVTNLTARAMLLTSLTAVTGNTSSALSSSQDISRPLQGINLKTIVFYTHLGETIRWPATMGVLSILLVFCVILLFGVARHSRCCLITFSVFGLFAVIVNWMLTSVYLATSVAMGDLCVAPEDFLRYESPSTLQAEVLKYYMLCEPSQMNPFTQRLREAQRGVDAMTANLANVARLADQLYHKNDLHPRLDILTKDIQLTDKLVSSLAALLDCRPLHKQYLEAVRAVCDLGLYGMAFMLLASVSAGLIFTVLVWVDSHTWIYIRKRRDYLQVDEQDPFLPPSAASQAIAARTLRNQGNGEEKSKYGPYRESNLGGGMRGGHVHSHPHTHSTLPRAHMSGPNHGQYATLTPQVSHIDGSYDTEMDSYNVFSTRTTLESIAPITSQDSFTQPVKTPDTFHSTLSRKREKSQESFYPQTTSKPMESFCQPSMMTKSSTLSRQHIKTIEVPRVPDTYSKTLNRSKSKEGHYEPFMFRSQQSPSEPHYQPIKAKTPMQERNDMIPDLTDAGYMITEL